MKSPASQGPGEYQTWAVFLAMMAFGSAGAEASAVTYKFGGVVTMGEPSAGIAAGATFSGTFGVAPNELVRGYGFQGDQSYSANSAGSPASESMTLSFAGGPTFTLPPGSLGLSVFEPGLTGWDPPGHPQTGTELSLYVTLPGGMQIHLDLDNPARTLDPALTVPSPIRLGDYTTAKLSELASSNSTAIAPGTPVFIGTVTSLEPIPTPEPATLLILGPGVAVCAARRGFRMTRRPH